MDSASVSANMTVHFKGSDEASVLIDSTSLFMVFSVTFTLLAHVEFIVLINNMGLPFSHQQQNKQRVCTERYISSFPNRTFICPHILPNTFQNIAAFGLKEDITGAVSKL